MENQENTTKEKHLKPFNIFMFLLIFLLIVSNGFSVYYITNLKNKKIAEKEQKIDKIDNKATETKEKETEVLVKDSDQDGLSDEDEINIYKTDPLNKNTDGDAYDDNEEIMNGYDPLVNEAQVEADRKIKNLKQGEIYVKWNEIKTKVDYWALFDNQSVAKIVDEYEKKNTYGQLETNTVLNKFDIYKVGTIEKGVYVGSDLFILTHRPEGPAFRDSLYRVIKNENDLILLTSHSDSTWGIDDELFIKSDDISIINLDEEKEIAVPNSDIKLLSSNNPPRELLVTTGEPTKIFETENETVYIDNNGCYLTELGDGTAKQFNLDLKFVSPREDERGHQTNIPNVLDITWLNDEENTFEYTSPIGGCGTFNCYDRAEYIENENQLTLAGKTGTGDNIYELKEDIIVDDTSKKGVLQAMYDFYSMGPEETSYDEFLNSHPLIFWQDPFGEYVQFQNAKFQPAVECGKPVIYLYPEEELDALVYVQPNGGFSLTEPVYNNGWRVKASPSGEIYNYDDKTTYPYLFWEGHGTDYIRPEKGFVVERSEVKTFLEEKLSVLGLIKKEYDEFIDFWLPKMQEKEFYFITFMPKEDFDKIAPLSVYPEPDTVIRVFMDFEGLDEKITVEEQNLETPERKGFSVVEWGGALH